MLRRREAVSTVGFFAAFLSTGAAVDTTYSCYFPTKCTTPDGECVLASVRRDFSPADASSNLEVNGRRVFSFPDLTVIYVQENSKPIQDCSPHPCVKSTLLNFLDDAASSIETARGVCQIDVEATDG